MDDNEYDNEQLDIRVQIRRDTYPELFNLLINIKKSKRSEKLKQLALSKIMGANLNDRNNNVEINNKIYGEKKDDDEYSRNKNPNLKYDLGEGALDNFIE